jgi:S1-C subfamily serine protease
VADDVGAAEIWEEGGPSPTIAFAQPGGAPKHRPQRRRRATARTAPKSKHQPAVVVALVAGLIGGVAGGGVVAAWHLTSSPTVVQVTVVRGAPGPALAGGNSIPTIATKALQSVVTITATGPGTSVIGGGSPGVEQGTGMMIDDQGDILTNNHVIAGSVALSVTLHGQIQPVSAVVIGTDPSQDLALVRMTNPPAGLVPVIFGDSDSLLVGDAVVAIGDALGLSAGTPTVTSGIVSALGRTVDSVNTSGTSSGSGGPLYDMIQTDAPINPGNSGGPLLDSAGRVVGMNTAVVSTSADNTPVQDIGFAIPSARLISAIGDLERGGPPSKAMLGVQVISNTAELQSQYGLEVSDGAVVTAIVDGSPAANAGVKVGDVIVGYAKRAVTTAEDLQNDIQAGSVGQKVTLTIWRQKHKLLLQATLESSSVAR